MSYISFFNQESIFFLINIYSDLSQLALKYLKDTEININNVLIMTSDFNIRDNLWDPDFLYYLIYKDTLRQQIHFSQNFLNLLNFFLLGTLTMIRTPTQSQILSFFNCFCLSSIIIIFIQTRDLYLIMLPSLSIFPYLMSIYQLSNDPLSKKAIKKICSSKSSSILSKVWTFYLS